MYCSPDLVELGGQLESPLLILLQLEMDDKVAAVTRARLVDFAGGGPLGLKVFFLAAISSL